MGRRRNIKSSKNETLISETEIDTDEIGITEDEGAKKGFFACYLLTSINPRFKRHTYIGFTVNPRRRIKQHNGEMRSGALRTKTKRPWEMVLCIHGFPTNVSALQFEWAWQNPMLSLAVRKAAANFKSLTGLDNQIKLAYTMLTLPAWQNLKLTVNFFSTKYTKHSSSCPSLPEQMKIQVRSMDDLPCYNDCEDWFSDDDDGDNDSADKSNETDVIKQGSAANMTSVLPSSEEDPFEPMESPIKSPSPISPILEEDHSNDPSELIESPIKLRNLSVDIVDSTQEDTMFEWNVSSLNFGQPSRKRSPVEVIELMSPSPDCRISLHSKRNKRASRISSDIIDLTRSPVFIQL